MIRAKQFQNLLLRWFDVHGRKHLPWQQNKTPYRVWISEIMLQQTQVTTVIPYFARFLQRFPDLKALSSAPEDDVLHQWAGLGYYSRARNLHKAAKLLTEIHDGKFPDNIPALVKLPGIGPSTAGAILAIAFNRPATILDGNVKRVLARIFNILDPIDDKKIENQLWELAEKFTPDSRIADYTQAMMDLGATLCTKTKPGCATCPFTEVCLAHRHNNVSFIPRKKQTRPLPVYERSFLILRKQSLILLEKRPPHGIWGGLWSLPELDGAPDEESLRLFCRQYLQTSIKTFNKLDSFRHTFSHYHLDIHPILILLGEIPLKLMDGTREIWYNLKKPQKIGLPKPIQFIMRSLP